MIKAAIFASAFRESSSADFLCFAHWDICRWYFLAKCCTSIYKKSTRREVLQKENFFLCYQWIVFHSISIPALSLLLRPVLENMRNFPQCRKLLAWNINRIFQFKLHRAMYPTVGYTLSEAACYITSQQKKQQKKKLLDTPLRLFTTQFASSTIYINFFFMFLAEKFSIIKNSSGCSSPPHTFFSPLTTEHRNVLLDESGMERGRNLI